MDFERLIEDSGDALAVHDGAWRYTYLNAEAERLLGRPCGQLVGRVVWEVFPRAVGTELYERHLRVMRDRTPDHFEYRLGPDGPWLEVRVFPTERGDAAGGVLSYSRDITARKGAEARLRDNLNLLGAIAHGSADAVFVKDAEGRYLFANDAVARAVGRPVSEIVGRFDGDILPPETARVVRENDLMVMSTGELLTTEEVVAGPDGAPRHFLATKSPYHDATTGTIVGVIAISRDVTDRRAAEAERAVAAERERRFLREMLSGLTEGRFRLCETKADLPAPLPAASEPIVLSPPTLRLLRARVGGAAEALRFPKERAQDLVTAVGEAAMNAVRHAGGGESRVHADAPRGVIQVWVRDSGPGIAQEQIHRALERGWTTGGLGHGFWLMLRNVDRIYLLTGPEGTTVVLEHERNPPLPHWLGNFGGEPAVFSLPG